MLSVLIPIYNFDCTPLIESLNYQLIKSKIDFEIICIDDTSTHHFEENDTINGFENTSYTILSENIGRSRIRNLLASKAKYPWLLFLDTDTLPTQSNYISLYVDLIKTKTNADVINGGLSYREKDKTTKNNLRFKYGIHRESLSHFDRNKKPYLSLLMSNTLIRKSIFKKVQFNEKIKKYGHEDSLFSSELKQNNYKVLHISNPVYHIGIESNKIFIEKSKIAVKNLFELYQLGVLKPEMNKLLKWHQYFSKIYLKPLLARFYILFNKKIENSLSKEDPSLFLFDLYRISYLSYIAK